MGQMQTPGDVIASKSTGFFYSQDAKCLKKFNQSFQFQSVDPPKNSVSLCLLKTKIPMTKIETRSEAHNCPSETSKIKRYPPCRDSGECISQILPTGESFSNSSLKTHRRIIQSLPIFHNLAWSHPFVGLQPCRERMGVEPMFEEGPLDLCCEFFDDPSRYWLAKMVVRNDRS